MPRRPTYLLRTWRIQLAAVLIAPAALAQPQPDCRTLSQPTERAICLDPSLTRFDRSLTTLYKQLHDRLAPTARAALRREQGIWRSERDACGARTTCIRTAYGERIDFLQRTIRTLPPAADPAPQTAGSAAKRTTSPTLPDWLCPGEADIRSVNSRVATEITFRVAATSTAAVYKIYWLDYAGRRQPRATLSNGKERTQKTYVTHPWIITRQIGSGPEQCMQIVMPDPGGRTVTLR